MPKLCKNKFRKIQPHDQIIYTFDKIMKGMIICHGCELSGIFVDGKNTKKNS
jgi:hypothetical protein